MTGRLIIPCMFCENPATMTVTSNISHHLAHWPVCRDHVAQAAERIIEPTGDVIDGTDLVQPDRYPSVTDEP